MIKPTLINDYEAYTADGNAVSNEFSDLIHDFIVKNCDKYDSTQIEYTCSSNLQVVCAERRLTNAVLKRKKERDNG